MQTKIWIINVIDQVIGFNRISYERRSIVFRRAIFRLYGSRFWHSVLRNPHRRRRGVLMPILLLLFPKENPEQFTSISVAVVFLPGSRHSDHFSPSWTHLVRQGS